MGRGARNTAAQARLTAGFYSFEQCEAARSGNADFATATLWAGNGSQRRSRYR
jgi:hypothetical protein